MKNALLAVALVLTALPGTALAQETSGSVTLTKAQPERRPSLLAPAILAGTGLAAATVGIVLVATAPDTPSNCSDDTQTCTRTPGSTDEAFRDAQDRAGRAHALPMAGWLTVGIGGMLAAAGVLTFVFGREHAPRHASLAPWLSGAGGGVGATGTF